MKTNLKYMNGDEFKKRQSCFEFFTSIAAEAVDFLIQFRNECRAGWCELFAKPQPSTKPQQLTIDFMRTLDHWATWTPNKNLSLFQIP